MVNAALVLPMVSKIAISSFSPRINARYSSSYNAITGLSITFKLNKT